MALFSTTVLLTLWAFMLYYLIVQPCESPMYYALYYALVSNVVFTVFQIISSLYFPKTMATYFQWVYGIVTFGNCVLYIVLLSGYAEDCRYTGVYTVSVVLLTLYICGLFLWYRVMSSLLAYDASVRMFGSRQSTRGQQQ